MAHARCRTIGSIVLLAAAGSLLRGAPAGAQCDPAPRFNTASHWGVNASYRPLDDLPGTPALMKAGGLGWMRVDFSWADLEPNRGERHWERVEPAIDRALAQGFSILGTFFDVPLWARRNNPSPCPKNGDGLSTPPRDDTMFAEFAGAAAAYFRHKVAAWEVWNEPDGCGFWDGNAQDFRQLIFRRGFDALRANAHPTAFVGGPGVIGTSFDNWYTYFDGTRNVLLRPIDFYSFHSYQSVAGVKAALDTADGYNRCTYDNAVCTRDLQVWLTEFGFYSGPVGNCEFATQVNNVGNAANSIYDYCWYTTNRCFRAFYWDTMQPDRTCNMPLLNNDGTPRAHFCTIELHLTGGLVPPC